MADTGRESMVTEECLQELLDFFVKSAYRARTVDRRYEIIHKRCIHMVARDYKIDIIDNKLGQLCAHYPSELIIIERELDSPNTDRECVNDVLKLRELIPPARFARCRSRFVVPVILFQNKNICRSSTLSSMAELYGRSGFDWILTLPTVGIELDDRSQGSSDTPTATAENAENHLDGTASESDWVLLNKVRGQDVQLLKALGVSLICDLMVEKKKLKYGLYVCSSEKVDKWARYADFHIASMPYPGCEFFKDYKDNGYNAVALKFDWNQGFVDAALTVPKDLEGAFDGPYKDYQNWDLIEMTQKYLKMLLQYLVECDGGMLIHCISGWDRTPLYISLLRLSLWADGQVHRSLCPAEMLYFTLAYDWLIYGHQLRERHDKGEEVMYFCFDFLKYIVTEDFSVLDRETKSSRLKQTAPTATDATPTSCTSTEEARRDSSVAVDEAEPGKGRRGMSGSSGRNTPAKMEGFDVNPPLGSSYELGESWVGVGSGSYHTSSSSSLSNSTSAYSASVLPPQECGSDEGVSLDCLNQRCKYFTGQKCHHSNHRSSSSPSQSVRGRRLNRVRELFLKSFRNSIPDTPTGGASGGTLAGLTGFLSKLASSVVKPNSSV